MNTLPVHTYADIMALKPCFDPAERGYCTRDWSGTALDVLRHPDVSASHKLWLVLREGWLPAAILHELALRRAESALALVENPDQRSVDAPIVKRRWLRGEATDDELAVARDAAWYAAWDARDAAKNASDAVASAAWAAASAAAKDPGCAAMNASAAGTNAQVEMLIHIIESACAA